MRTNSIRRAPDGKDIARVGRALPGLQVLLQADEIRAPSRRGHRIVFVVPLEPAVSEGEYGLAFLRPHVESDRRAFPTGCPGGESPADVARRRQIVDSDF